MTLLAPGVNNNGPGGTDRPTNVAITISGARSFENLFTVDGFVANENLRGQPHDLFIEDAIQETTVLTGSISAEYGRFTGGVVNAITKSGGNTLSGSFRTTFTNDKWTENDPYNAGTGRSGVSTSLSDSRVDEVNELRAAHAHGARDGGLGPRLRRERAHQPPGRLADLLHSESRLSGSSDLRDLLLHARGALRTDTVSRTDLAMNVSVKVFESLELFIRPELLNVFNEKAFTGGRLGIDSDLTVLTAKTSGTAAYAPFNPATQTPVRGAAGTGANYNLGPNFGKAIGPSGYQLPRTFRASVGLRF